MNLVSRTLIFSILFSIGDFKSLDLKTGIESENQVTGGNIIREIDSKISQKEMELKELKRNIGKVGNKLEGIVYEVLKDFLDKDFESNESKNEHQKNTDQLTKEEESVTETLLKKYYPTFRGREKKDFSVIEDEVVHSEKKHFPNQKKKDSYLEKSPSTENILEYTIEPPAENQLSTMKNPPEIVSESISIIQNNSRDMDQNMNSIEKNKEKYFTHIQDASSKFQNLNGEHSTKSGESRITEIPTMSKGKRKEEPLSEEVKIRKRRMIQSDPEQIRSVDNFVEPSLEQSERIQKSRRKFESVMPEEPSVVGIIQAPEEEIRISHRRSDSRTSSRNTARRENLLNIPRESHRKRKVSSGDGQIEEVPEISRSKRIMTPEDQISENQETSKAQKIPLESEDKKIMRMNSADNSDRVDDTKLGQAFSWGNQPSQPCYEKNGREDLLEKQHIEDLKYEVGKLRSVVDLLREQQRLLNSFDYGGKKDLNGHEMLDVLNQLNNKDTHIGHHDNIQTNGIDTGIKAKYEELEQIKFQLKEAIENLNRTKEILNLEHKKELNLEEELKNQKTEINWLKLIMENFIIAQTKKDKGNIDQKLNEFQSKKDNKTEDPIVGAAFNRTIPSTVRMAEDKIREFEAEHFRNSDSRENSNTMMNMRSSISRARANEFSTIGKLLDVINDKQSKTDDDDIQLKLLEAVSDLKKKKDKENLTKDLLKKLQGGVESKSDDDDLSQLLKIQKALKGLDAPQTKIDDLGIEDQLKLLQREINKLRPNDDLNFLPSESKAPANNNAQFQAMLTRLIAANPQFQGMKLPQTTPQQLMQMQKKLNMVNSMTTAGLGAGVGTGIGTGVSTGMGQGIGTGLGTGGNIGGDVGTGSQAALMNALGKMGSLYAPYAAGYVPLTSPIYKYGPFGKDIDLSSAIGPYAALYGGLGNSGFGALGLGGNGYSSGNGYATAGGYSSPSISSYVPKSPYGASILSGYNPNYLSAPYKPTPYSALYSNPNPYGSKIEQYNSEKSYGGNNFFQVPQPNSYGGGPPSSYFPPKAFDPASIDKVNTNQYPYAGSALPYAADKVDDLKTQIYGLQTAISSYNRPEYTQTPEDRNTIYSLEQQIEELKSIVSTLNGYPADQPSYFPPAGNLESVGYGAPDAQLGPDVYNNRASEKRRKRSVEDEKSESKHKIDDNEEKEKRKKRSVDENSSKKEDPGVFSKLTSMIGTVFNGVTEERNSRERRSNNNAVEDSPASGVIEQLTSALRDVLDEEPDAPTSPNLVFQPSPIHLPRSSSNHIRNPSNEAPNHHPLMKHATLEDIKQQIDHLKKQLGHHKTDEKLPEINKNAEPPIFNQISPFSPRHALMPEPSYNNYNNYNYGSNGLVQFPSDLSVKPKKLDIFKSIVAKIMDKVIESLPVILHKLFGFAVHELTAYGDYGTSYGGYGSDNGLFKVFRNLGVFGYLPLILLRIVNALSTFIYILQKNKFLKYFLVPAGVVLIVGASMVFLIWWMQPSDNYLNYEKSYDKYSYDKQYSDGYDNQNDYGKSSGQIIKSYGNDEGKQRLNTYKSSPEVKTIPYTPNNVAYPPFYKPPISIAPDYMMPS